MNEIINIIEYFQNSKALLITAGAGMGVDSGLPDFRGDHGFWKAYPMYERLNLSFVDAANPVHFSQDPHFGWGFYGHRLNLYRQTVPHRGFHLVQAWAKRFGLDLFVVTSNVDGQFQKSGVSEGQILEVHGSIHHLQCVVPCGDQIWPNQEKVEIDLNQMRALQIPRCSHCGKVARPNILMFGDWTWDSSRTGQQHKGFESFLEKHQDGHILIIEIGAGSAVPTIRQLTESVAMRYNATALRINPTEPNISDPNLSLKKGGLEALEAIEREMA